MPEKSTRARPIQRKGKNKRPHGFAQKYGLLRNGVYHVPWLVSWIEVIVVHALRNVAHILLFVSVIIEIQNTGNIHGRDAVRRLLAIIFDVCLGLMHCIGLICSWIGLVLGHGDCNILYHRCSTSMTSLLRLGLLQSLAATSLYFFALVRWRYRSSKFKEPPLLPFLAYFVVPITGLSAWLVTLTPGDHNVGWDAWVDLCLIASIFTLRAFLFGWHGFPRAPRKLQPSLDILLPGAFLSVFVYVLARWVLRTPWFERRMNWKYIVCAVNLAWPWWAFPRILDIFRHPSQLCWSRQEPRAQNPT